jgi:uncharacterized membrane protein (UPF0127 family)
LAYRLVVGAHRLRFSIPVSAVVLVAAIVAGLAFAAGRGEPAARLKLDGVALRPELAMTSDQRSVGLMNRRKAPADGMLFVFHRDTTGAFWMKNTLVPLTIVFFDRNGSRVRKLSMVPCKADPCPVYEPGRRYRFALELRATDRRLARRLGPLAEIRRLSRLAE